MKNVKLGVLLRKDIKLKKEGINQLKLVEKSETKLKNINNNREEKRREEKFNKGEGHPIELSINNNCFQEYIDLTFKLNMSTNKLGVRLSLVYMSRQMGMVFNAIILYLIIMIINIFKKRDYKSISILLTLIMTILLNVIGATVDYHYYIMFIPVLILMCCDLFNWFHNYKTTTTIIYLLILVMIGTNIWDARYNFYLPQPQQDVIDYIKENTNCDDKIAVLGFNDEIYYLSEREPVSKYTYVLSNRAFN